MERHSGEKRTERSGEPSAEGGACFTVVGGTVCTGTNREFCPTLILHSGRKDKAWEMPAQEGEGAHGRDPAWSTLKDD